MALLLVYASDRGPVLGGDLYDVSFIELPTKGSSLLLLVTPMVTAALALAIH